MTIYFISKYITIIIVSYVFVIFTIPYCYRKILTYRWNNFCRKKSLILLSFDDGPGKQTTKELLGLLDKRQVKATFFILGRKAVSNPEIVAAISNAGHTIGNHSENHINAWKTPFFRVIKDIHEGHKSILSCGVKSLFFRPPHGKITLWSLLYVKLFLKNHLCWWTIDSGDTWKDLPDLTSTAHNIVKNKGIILLHDFDRVGTRSVARKKYVLQLTNLIIDLAKKEGLTFITMDELLFLRSTL